MDAEKPNYRDLLHGLEIDRVTWDEALKYSKKQMQEMARESRPLVRVVGQCSTADYHFQQDMRRG